MRIFIGVRSCPLVTNFQVFLQLWQQSAIRRRPCSPIHDICQSRRAV